VPAAKAVRLASNQAVEVRHFEGYAYKRRGRLGSASNICNGKVALLRQHRYAARQKLRTICQG
jgi:hypothetical protein